jgi:hypothetical protein
MTGEGAAEQAASREGRELPPEVRRPVRRLALCLTAHMAFRMDARVQGPATVAATLLVVDAWFDITTSTTRTAATEALILALVAELPAAIISLHIAHRVSQRVRALALAEHVKTRHLPVTDRQQAHPAVPSDAPFAAELPRDE